MTRLIVGIGNADAGDDAVGPAVIAALRRDPRCDAALTLAQPTDLPNLLDGVAAAAIVDACRSGAAPGTVLYFDVQAADLPQEPFALSTHGFGLAAGLALARAVGTLPPVCTVIAVEGDRFVPGAAMSPAVSAAVPEAARQAAASIGLYPGTPR